MIKTTCKVCGKDFSARAYQIKISTGKYCSPKCRGIGVNKSIPVKDRIYKFIDKKGEDDCWEFIGCRNSDGYGRIGTTPSKNESAHRIIYKLEKGDIPKGNVVMHTCDNPPCCNPKHLILGTQNDNIQDMVSKQRHVYNTKENCNFAKLTEKQVIEIKNKYTGKRGDKVKLAKEYSVVVTTITNILNNKTWKN